MAAIVEHADQQKEADTPTGADGGDLARFRLLFYDCLQRRADAVFELTEAVLCADGPVRSLVELSLVGEHRRGHGSLYAALDRGRLDIDRLADGAGRGHATAARPGPTAHNCRSSKAP